MVQALIHSGLTYNSPLGFLFIKEVKALNDKASLSPDSGGVHCKLSSLMQLMNILDSVFLFSNMEDRDRFVYYSFNSDEQEFLRPLVDMSGVYNDSECLFMCFWLSCAKEAGKHAKSKESDEADLIITTDEQQFGGNPREGLSRDISWRSEREHRLGVSGHCVVDTEPGLLSKITAVDSMNSVRSKEDHVIGISKSVFVTNFPDYFRSRDLWSLCEAYGKVVDVYIPNRKSKAGKRFAFVRFIRVDDMDRLISNLCTIWVGRLHLHANAVRYERSSKPSSSARPPTVKVHAIPPPTRHFPSSFVTVVNDNHSFPVLNTPGPPALVLDDDCVHEEDLSRCVIGKVKDLNSISNLYIILNKEGFADLQLSYLGGHWVRIDLMCDKNKNKLLLHKGVHSWFDDLKAATNDFVSSERIVWVDIEGIPLYLWSHATFSRISKKWGEVVDIEESVGSSFARKRICVKTSRVDNILETFKVVFKGKTFTVRAKELFSWTPSFLEYKEEGYISEDESALGDHNNTADSLQGHGGKGGGRESEDEGVSDTIFGDNIHSSPCNNHTESQSAYVQQSDDPFGFYDLLKKPLNVRDNDLDPSLSHPPGFTPETSHQENFDHSPAHQKVNRDEPLHEEAPSLKSKSEENRHANESHTIDFSSEASTRVHSRTTLKGGSLLDVLDDMIKILSLNVQGLGHKTKKEWVKELNNKHGVNFLALQETKMDCISHLDVKFMWGNSNYQFVASDSVGNSGGILCVWEESIFKKENVSMSDNFIAIYGTWLPTNTRILIVAIYAPQPTVLKRILWEYISGLINRWNGETIVLGDFNEVRFEEERFGSIFNQSCARDFNLFISSSSLVDVKMEGYSFTWVHPSAKKMSKLDRFLVSEGIILGFPAITAVCLDRHLSDHRPILLKEIHTDFGPTPFRTYHSWFSREGFDAMVEQAWSSFTHNDSNRLIRFKKKLQDLKSIICGWVRDSNSSLAGSKNTILKDLGDIDKALDNGCISDELLVKRMELLNKFHELNQLDSKDAIQKAKVKWAIEGDENSKFFHGIINKRRSQLAIRGVFVSGDWHTKPSLVKDNFLEHFSTRFKQPSSSRLKLSLPFPTRLSSDQVSDLDRNISTDEIRAAVWDCGENKSPGPDGYTFEFFRRYWNVIGPDFSSAVACFFENGSFPRGCNASFIALIPKVVDAKLVTDFRPISLIGSVYKVVTKILANRLATVISDLVSNTQSAFVANRQILDGPFILNEVLSWCKRKRKQALVFKVDFAKAYDSVRWDFLLDILHAFGFGSRWCTWIRGIFTSNMASILVNGSPTAEFPMCCGLKQGDPLAPLLFILVMETLHISVSRAANDGIFRGLHIQGSVTLSHLFYADDAVFIGEWSESNLDNIIRILNCFYLASGLRINVSKSQVLGIGVPSEIVQHGASRIGCDIMHTPFKYLGVMVGDHMSRLSAWSNSIQKIRAKLSKWKVKTLSIGGRLILLKSVLGATPVYNMSIYKAPLSVLHEMEMLRNKFFIGGDAQGNKITWVSWDKVLSSKNNGGLGVSSFYALNRALLLKWVWRFLSHDCSLWSQIIRAIHGSRLDFHSRKCISPWGSILREIQVLDTKGFDFLSHCKVRIGDGLNTRFWLDVWILDMPLCARFPRIFALENDTNVSVAVKQGAPSLDASFRRPVRDGVERLQWEELVAMVGDISLSSSADRWVCDLNGDEIFVPIKVNIFAWRARLDRLPTRDAHDFSSTVKNFESRLLPTSVDASLARKASRAILCGWTMAGAKRHP
ncbi:RNA-directed DNA polymerase, eukaryota, partial [Tanacetum coccineum]